MKSQYKIRKKKSEKLKNLYVARDHPGDNNSSILLNHLISNIKPSIKEENRNEISKFLKSKAKFISIEKYTYF